MKIRTNVRAGRDVQLDVVDRCGGATRCGGTSRCGGGGRCGGSTYYSY